MQTLPPPQPLSRSAARMARHRLRRKQGLRSLTIDIREAEIETLIQRGRLAPESRGDLAPSSEPYTGSSTMPCGDAPPGRRVTRDVRELTPVVLK